MSTAEKYDVLVLGGGTAGKLIAWTMAKEGRRTAVVDRKYVGGSCPNVACLPSKNVIHSAKVASLVRRHREFGIETGPIAIDMAGVYARKREMVDGIIQVHLDKYRAALNQDRGDELIFGDGTFVAPRTVHVALRDGGERTLAAARVFVDVGTHATIPDTAGLREAKPMTHIEALDLQRRPDHLIVLGGGYVGLELSQALRRLGSRVTLISRDSQLAANEDADVSEAVLQLFRDEGIDVLLNAHVLGVNGLSGNHVSLQLQSGNATQTVEGTDILVAPWTYAEHERHRTREGRNRGHGKRTHPGERSPGNNRAQRVGDGRVRRQPILHACIRGRFLHHSRKPERRPSQHEGPAGSVLRLH